MCHDQRKARPFLRRFTRADLLDHLTRFRAEVGQTASADRPDWCGRCDERTRLAEDGDGRPQRCPDCHPLTAGRVLAGAGAP